MEIKHMKFTDNLIPTEMTMQLMRTTCPLCHEAVQFALHNDDRLFEKDAEYYQERCEDLAKQVYQLNKTIQAILNEEKCEPEF